MVPMMELLKTTRNGVARRILGSDLERFSSREYTRNRIETFLEEQEIGRLSLGQKVDILIDGMEGQIFSGTISSFGRKAEFSPKYIISEKERRSLLYRVKISIDVSGSKPVFKLGMPVTILIK